MTISERDLRIAKECADTDEPCIVFRAKDKHAMTLLDFYLEELCGNDPDITDEFIAAVEERVQHFRSWQAANPDRVKTPDLREGESHS